VVSDEGAGQTASSAIEVGRQTRVFSGAELLPLPRWSMVTGTEVPFAVMVTDALEKLAFLKEIDQRG
jgi:hypothetical protein